MTYSHITVDAGAAAKFYHVVWNNPEEFKRFVINLGDFHGMMEFLVLSVKSSRAAVLRRLFSRQDFVHQVE